MSIKFLGIETRVNDCGIKIFNVDGYTDKKTISGAVREIGREIAKIDKGTGEMLINYSHTKEDALNMLVRNTYNPDEFCFELEEVGCASKYNEETGETEYADGNYYFYIRFFE